MLRACNAFIIAPSEAACRSLVKLARRVGFGDIGSPFEPHPLTYGLTFFMVHYQLSTEAMQRVVAEVRGSLDVAARYSPIVLISDDCPIERLLGYIQVGCDDVIPLPENCDVLEARLAAQLHTDVVYFATDDYLGPDRRRMERPEHDDPRRTGTAPFTRLTVRRDPATGISVKEHVQQPAAAPQPGGARVRGRATLRRQQVA